MAGALKHRVAGRAALTLLVAAGCECGPNAPRPAAGDPTRAPPSLAPSQPDGLYFGVSDAPEGRRGWLLRFQPAARGGVRLYAPPDDPELVGAEVRGRADSIVLRSQPGLGGVYYVFTGRAEGQEVRGVVETVRARRPADSVMARATVTLAPVASEPPMPSGGGAGVYSDVAMNDESGDLSGREVVLLPARGGRTRDGADE